MMAAEATVDNACAEKSAQTAFANTQPARVLNAERTTAVNLAVTVGVARIAWTRNVNSMLASRLNAGLMGAVAPVANVSFQMSALREFAIA
jgi:hypothetical protein